MKIPPLYKITPEILELVAKIDANKIFFSEINIPFEIKQKIQRVSTLKSSLFSARIEGNPLTLKDLEEEDGEIKKIEVFNILRGIEFIQNIEPKTEITKDLILELHQITMKGLSYQGGKFRTEVSAIFNQAGIAVYMPPPPKEIPLLINQLLKYIDPENEKFPLIKAFISHLIFEKIHPFMDGNGRVGRLLVFLILKLKDEKYNLYIPFEEFIDENKSDYYYFLDIGMKNSQDYLLFMLKAFYEQTERIKNLITQELEKKETLFLPPRQEEIYNIIKDHRVVSFDMIWRRFLNVPKRTLRYDLKKLLDMTLIVKTGKTRGNYYRINE